MQPQRPELPPVIALCGPAGVGKSTLARALARLAPRIDVDWFDGADRTTSHRLRLLTEGVVVSLASPLKRMLRILGVPSECLTGELADKERPLDLLCGRTARHAMQSLGTEWGRECIHPEIWLRAWEHAARTTAAAGGCPSLTIVDDLRFDNERQYIQKLGGIVVRLFREGRHYEGDHASERGPATYDCAVELESRSAPAMLGDSLDPLGPDGRNAAVVLQAAVTADSKSSRLAQRPPFGPEIPRPTPMDRLLRSLYQTRTCT